MKKLLVGALAAVAISPTPLLAAQVAAGEPMPDRPPVLVTTTSAAPAIQVPREQIPAQAPVQEAPPPVQTPTPEAPVRSIPSAAVIPPSAPAEAPAIDTPTEAPSTETPPTHHRAVPNTETTVTEAPTTNAPTNKTPTNDAPTSNADITPPQITPHTAEPPSPTHTVMSKPSVESSEALAPSAGSVPSHENVPSNENRSESTPPTHEVSPGSSVPSVGGPTDGEVPSASSHSPSGSAPQHPAMQVMPPAPALNAAPEAVDVAKTAPAGTAHGVRFAPPDVDAAAPPPPPATQGQVDFNQRVTNNITNIVNNNTNVTIRNNTRIDNVNNVQVVTVDNRTIVRPARWNYVDYDEYRRPVFYNPIDTDMTFRYFYGGDYREVFVPRGGRIVMDVATLGVFPFTAVGMDGNYLTAGYFNGGAWIPPDGWAGPPPPDWAPPPAPVEYDNPQVYLPAADRSVTVSKAVVMGHDDSRPPGQQDAFMLDDTTLAFGTDHGDGKIDVTKTQSLPGVGPTDDGQSLADVALLNNQVPQGDGLDWPWVIGAGVALAGAVGAGFVGWRRFKQPKTNVHS